MRYPICLASGKALIGKCSSEYWEWLNGAVSIEFHMEEDLLWTLDSSGFNN